MIYRAHFTGRTIGAIGIFYKIAAYTHGENEEEARLNLYDRYEHIMFLELTAVEAVDVETCTPQDRLYLTTKGLAS